MRGATQATLNKAILRPTMSESSAALEAALEGFDCRIVQEVHWGDMDAYGHVNNAVYFRYFEDIRMAHLERLGAHAYMQKHNIGPILGATSARFKAALVYPDTITCGSRIAEVGEDRFVMQYRVFSHTQDRVACEGEGRVVYFDYGKGGKTAIPETIRAAMNGG